MPLYEYLCEACGKVSDFLMGVGRGDAKISCRHCGSLRLKQKLSVSNFSMRGSRIGSHEGKTCCGSEERCDTPPCSTGGVCKR